MERDKNNSNDDYDILEDFSLLGQQVSEFMEKDEQVKDSNPSEFTQDREEGVSTSDNKEGTSLNKVDTSLNKIENVNLKDEENTRRNSADNTDLNDVENASLNDLENTDLNDTEHVSLNPTDDTMDFLAQEVAAVKEEAEDNIHKENGDTFLSEEPELEEINDSLGEQISNAIDEDTAFHEHQTAKKKKKKKIIIGSSIAAALVIVICVLLLTKAGQKAVIETVVAPNLYDGVFQYEETTTTPPIEYDSLLTGDDQSSTLVDTKEEDNIVNVLLVGVEEIEYAQNTDVMIIASMNRDTNELSIISLMRDLYVQIPGHSNNKLNAAYSLGGIDLLYDTIELNFGVHMDGYVLVNFDTFETIVDLLGGISVTLTQDEASYLNRTNYISNPANRTVVAGTQLMNGNQALGYCRIRYVSTGKEINDFGRTARHRAILDAMFDKLMSKNLFQLVSFMNEVFSNVQLKTDISKTKFSEYLTEVVDLNVSALQQYRIPADDGYYDDKVYIGENKQWVLIPNDWQETKLLLHDYIYGDETTTHSTALNNETTKN